MRSLTITLPDDLARLVERKVSSGEYADPSDVVREGLRALDHEPEQLERWLRDEVLPTYDRLQAGRERVLTGEEVRSRLADHMKRSLAGS